MRVVALETSERIGTVAALTAQDDEVTLVEVLTLPGDQRSAQSLLPALHEMLDRCDWRAGDLDLICVTTGPGSFTGLRIGVTVAKTFAYASQAKLIGIPTLSAIAAGVHSKQPRLWAILDAQRQELFVACFTEEEKETAPEVSIMGIEEWLAELREGDSVVGPPLKKLAERLPAGVRMADEATWAPQAAVVGRLGIEAFLSGESDDPLQLVPHYYRKSAAEEKVAAAKPQA